MIDSWFYIQQWKNKRWLHIDVEMSLSDARHLWAILSNEMDNTNDVKPLAYVRKGDSHKVIMTPEEGGWEIVVCNAMFLNDGKDTPFLVQRRGASND